jgi:predicted PurR-regulated permease PerM
MPMSDHLRTVAYGAVAALCVGWVLHVGQGVFVPIVFSVLVVYVIAGLAELVFRLPWLGPRVPRTLGYTLAGLGIAWGLAAMASLVAASLGNVTALAPQYAAAVLNTIQELAARIGIETTPTWESLRRDLLAQVNTQRLIGSTVVSVTSIASSLVVVLLYVAFLLVEERVFAAKLAGLATDPGRVASLRAVMAKINGRVRAYLALKTAVSAVLGALTWAILAFFGVEFAPFWAVLAGVLNFIPYIGSVLGVVLPAAFSTMQFAGLDQVVAILLALSLAQFSIGFFLEPWLMGSSLNLSPFVILVCLAAWGALWGIPGAFLAVPLTASIALVLAEFDGTRPIAILLSKDGRIRT